MIMMMLIVLTITFLTIPFPAFGRVGNFVGDCSQLLALVPPGILVLGVRSQL